MGIAPSIAGFIVKNVTENLDLADRQGARCLTLAKQAVHIKEHELHGIICNPDIYRSRECPAHLPGRISYARDMLAGDGKLATTIPGRQGTGEISDLFFLMSIGFDVVHSVDASEYEGADIVFDLNKPDLCSTLGEPYDVVIDVGTTEHVFHVPNTLRNIAETTKVGGLVIHINPSNNVIDHGFYQFSPILFYQYYTENGFEPISCKFTREPADGRFGEPIQFFDYRPDIQGCTVDGSADATYGVAFCFRKTEKSSSDRIPQQGHYRNQW